MAGVWSLILASLCLAAPFQSADPPLRWGCDQEGGAPYCFLDGKLERVGFEVDIVRALEKKLGRKIQFTQYGFESLIPGLLKGDFDFAMNGLEVLPDRRQAIRFTRPYYLYRQQLTVRKGESRFTRYQELAGNTDRLVGTMDGTAAEALLIRDGVTHASYSTPTEAYRDLELGRLDAVLLDLPMARQYAADNPAFAFLGDPFAPGRYAIAVPPDENALADSIDRALNDMIGDGTLQTILTRWKIWDDFNAQYLATATSAADWEFEDKDSGYGWTIARYLPLLLDGARVTLLLTLASFALALCIGLGVATARLYGPKPIQILAIGYIEFFRGVPLLLLLFFLYFGLPSVLAGMGLPGIGEFITPFAAAWLGLGLTYGAYEAEIQRAAIQSVPPGQWEAAAALGMPKGLTFRRIILPQAVRIALPPTTGDLVALFKDTSVASAITLLELNKQYQILAKSSLKFVEIGLITAILYLALSVPLGIASRALEKKLGATHGK